MKKKKVVRQCKVWSVALILAATCGFATNVNAITVTDWAGLNTHEHIVFGNNITVSSDVISIKNAPAGQIIDGAGFSLNGLPQNSRLHVQGGSPIIQNIGSIVAGDSTNSSFSYVAQDGTTIYNNIENSVNGFVLPGAGISSFAAIHVTGATDTVVSNSVFYNNTHTNSSGAALFLQNSTNSIVEGSVFVGNVSEAGAAINLEGGNIEAIRDSIFVGNSATWDGAALNGSGFINSIENSIFENNSAGYTGGALWLGSLGEKNVVIKNSVFRGNSARYYGGAIYDDAYFAQDKLTLVDTDFIDNTAGDAGGAIFNMSLMNIVAENKDVVFSGNTANGSPSDIYFYLWQHKSLEGNGIPQGIINILAMDDKKISFDGTIVVDNEREIPGMPVINLNPESITYEDSNGQSYTVAGAGEVEFSNKVSGFDVNLHKGTLTIGENEIADKVFEGSNLNVLGDAFLNTANGVIGDLGANKITIVEGAELEYKLDVDLANQVSDSIFNTDNKGKIIINTVNITSDTAADGMLLQLSNGPLGNVEFKKNYYATTSLSTYKLTMNEDGELVVENYAKTGGLAGAVYDESSSYSVTIEGDQDIPAWISDSGNQVKSDLTVYGNGGKISSSTNADGLVVQEGVTLGISNVEEMSGFDNAIINEKGSVAITDTSFNNNTGDAVISNKQGDVTITAQNKDVTINAGSANSAIISDAGSVKLTGAANIGVVGDVIGKNGADLTLSANSNFSDVISGMDTLQTQGDVVIGTFKDAEYKMQNGSLKISNSIENVALGIDNGSFVLDGTASNTEISQSAGNVVVNGIVSNSVLNSTGNGAELGGSFIDSSVSLKNNTSIIDGEFTDSVLDVDTKTASIEGNFASTDVTSVAENGQLKGSFEDSNVSFKNTGTSIVEGNFKNGALDISGKISSIKGTFSSIDFASEAESGELSGSIEDSYVTFDNDTLAIVDAELTGSILEVSGKNSIIEGSFVESELMATADNGQLAGTFKDSFVSLNNNKSSFVEGTFTNSALDIRGGDVVLIGSFENSNLSLANSNVILHQGFSVSQLGLDDVSMSVVNNNIDSIAAENLLLTGDAKMVVDVDLNKEVMDTITAENVSTTPITTFAMRNINAHTVESEKSIIVTDFNHLSDSNRSEISINFAEGSIKDYVVSEVDSFTGKIFKYDVSYDKATGNFNFSAGGGSNYSNYTPSVFAAPVAAQLGGYLTQLNSYDEAFRNMDMYMLMPKAKREALKQANRVASLENGAFDLSVEAQKTNAGWFRPYVTMERVNLDNGPKVSNVAYGSYFGADSGMYYLGRGWEGVFSAYAGYTGSHQAYAGNSIYQNGGTFGLAGMAYRDNFFSGLTLNVGASAGSASTTFGNEDFVMLMSGLASKTGYNWELAQGKFIIQPSVLLAYSFVHTFDYTNAAGLDVSSNPLHAFTLEPGVKFIGNLSNGWQPYAGISMVWNVIDKTHFSVNDVTLPNLSVDPFVKYGVGVRKSFGERFFGFLQSYITNGGRNGIGFQTGFRWALGKSKPLTERSTTPRKLK